MQRKIICILISLMMMGSAVFFTACGDSADNSPADQTTQEETTEETIRAADPMTDEELENDDSEGCIEDSEDLLY